jgi:TPR repeat protein
MNKEYIDIIQLIAKEKGSDSLISGDILKHLEEYCLLNYQEMQYLAGELIRERHIFREIIRAGCPAGISEAENVPECKVKLAKKLKRDNALSPDKTADYLDLLGLLLRSDTSIISEDDIEAITENTDYSEEIYKKAFDIKFKEAKMGDAKAQHYVGCSYENGLGVTVDYAEAANWYAKAAEQGNENAKDALESLKDEGRI